MNHNEDIAYKSIKIISKSDSYNKNSGSLIVNGGIGCKNTIHTKNICADEGCFNKITTDTLSLQSFDNINIKFNEIEVNNLKVQNNEIDDAKIENLCVTKCIFKDIVPKDENSLVGNEDNKVNIIANNIKSNCLNVDIIKSVDIENSEQLYSSNAKIDNIKSDNIISIYNEFTNGYFDCLLPLNECSQIGNDELRPNIFANYMHIYNGVFKIDVKTNKLITDIGEVNLLKAKNAEIESLELDYGIYTKLLPENENSQIGNKHNRTLIYGSVIDTNKIEAKNICSSEAKLDDLSSNNIISEAGKFNNITFNRLLPENDCSCIGTEENKVSILSCDIKTDNIEVSNNLYSVLGKFDTLKSENIITKYIESEFHKFNTLIPNNENSSIGEENSRINIYSNNLDSDSIRCNIINTNIMNSQNIENCQNIYSLSGKFENLTADYILSDISYIKTLEYDVIIGKNGHSLIGKDTNRVNIYGEYVDINSLTAKFNNLLPENENALIGKSDERVNIYGDKVDIQYLSASFNNLVPISENSLIGNPDNRVNIYINELDADMISGKFNKLLPHDEDESQIGDQFNRVNLYGNKLNINDCITKRINGNYETLLPVDEEASIGDLANRTNIFGELIDTNKCIVKKLEVLDELKVNKMESINTFHYGKLIFNEGKFNSLLPDNYNSNIGNCDNRFNLYTNSVDSNFGVFNENLKASYLKANNLNVTDNVCISQDYKNNDMIKTDTENSKLDIIADFINIKSNNDGIIISDDGIEFDGLTIFSNIAINTNCYANEYIYPCKSLIFLTGNTERCYKLANNKNYDNNTCELTNGTFVKIINISNVNIIINGYILCNDADFYNFVYYNKWYCLNKGNKYNNTDNTTDDNNIINCSSINNDNDNDSDSCICNTDDVTYDNNCDD